MELLSYTERLKVKRRFQIVTKIPIDFYSLVRFVTENVPVGHDQGGSAIMDMILLLKVNYQSEKMCDVQRNGTAKAAACQRGVH